MEKLYVCVKNDIETALVAILTAERRGKEYWGGRGGELKCSGKYELKFKLGPKNLLPAEIVSKYFTAFTKRTDGELDCAKRYYTNTGTNDYSLEEFLYQFIPAPEDSELAKLLDDVRDKAFKEWEILKMRGTKYEDFQLCEKLPKGAIVFEKIAEDPRRQEGRLE
jgi:hypothetical protein